MYDRLLRDSLERQEKYIQNCFQEFQSRIESVTQMYESRVEKLGLELAANQDQLRILTTRSEELTALNADLSSKNESLSKFEKEYENLHQANNKLQDRLKVCFVFMKLTKNHW